MLQALCVILELEVTREERPPQLRWTRPWRRGPGHLPRAVAKLPKDPLPPLPTASGPWTAVAGVGVLWGTLQRWVPPAVPLSPGLKQEPAAGWPELQRQGRTWPLLRRRPATSLGPSQGEGPGRAAITSLRGPCFAGCYVSRQYLFPPWCRASGSFLDSLPDVLASPFSGTTSCFGSVTGVCLLRSSWVWAYAS